MAKVRRYIAPPWAQRPASKRMDARVVEAIARRRRQMLVHSCIYYRLDSNVVSDAQWSKWAQQLAGLQRKFGWRINFYDEVFRDWDGSSGFHLPTDPDVMRVARRTLAEHDERADLIG